MSERYSVAIETGWGPEPSARPVRLAGEGIENALDLSADEAEALAERLEAAAKAVRMFVGPRALRSQSGSLQWQAGQYPTVAARSCRLCGATQPSGVHCRRIDCPLNSTHKPMATQE